MSEATAMVEMEARTVVRLGFTPETLRHELEQEREMRQILQQYVKEAMRPGHHYYTFKEGDRPALTQEGAHNLCSIFKAIIGPPAIEKDYHEDGHLTVTAHVDIFHQSGQRIATGDGICSTREAKYAYRWAWDNEVAGLDVSGLKSKSGTSRNGKPWTQYQVPNADLADLYNTVLKMAVKRAKVAAVRQMPLVSELFVDDLEADDEKPPENRSYGGRSQKSEVRNQKPEPRDEVLEKVELLAGKLGEHGIKDEDLRLQYLPEGVEKWADLSADQAEAVRSQLVELLNQKVSKK